MLQTPGREPRVKLVPKVESREIDINGVLVRMRDAHTKLSQHHPTKALLADAYAVIVTLIKRAAAPPTDVRPAGEEGLF